MSRAHCEPERSRDIGAWRFSKFLSRKFCMWYAGLFLLLQFTGGMVSYLGAAAQLSEMRDTRSGSIVGQSSSALASALLKHAQHI